MIVCHCQVVNDQEIARAIEAGARTVAQVSRATGAGTHCGICVFTLKRMLCQDEEPEQDPSVEVRSEAS